jgi:hypothetical protein
MQIRAVAALVTLVALSNLALAAALAAAKSPGMPTRALFHLPAAWAASLPLAEMSDSLEKQGANTPSAARVLAMFEAVKKGRTPVDVFAPALLASGVDLERFQAMGIDAKLGVLVQGVHEAESTFLVKDAAFETLTQAERLWAKPTDDEVQEASVDLKALQRLSPFYLNAPIALYMASTGADLRHRMRTTFGDTVDLHTAEKRAEILSRLKRSTDLSEADTVSPEDVHLHGELIGGAYRRRKDGAQEAYTKMVALARRVRIEGSQIELIRTIAADTQAGMGNSAEAALTAIRKIAFVAASPAVERAAIYAIGDVPTLNPIYESFSGRFHAVTQALADVGYATRHGDVREIAAALVRREMALMTQLKNKAIAAESLAVIDSNPRYGAPTQALHVPAKSKKGIEDRFRGSQILGAAVLLLIGLSGLLLIARDVIAFFHGGFHPGEMTAALDSIAVLVATVSAWVISSTIEARGRRP